MTDERTPDQSDEKIEDLDATPEETAEVKGGRKAGEGQKEFLVVKLSDVLISS